MLRKSIGRNSLNVYLAFDGFIRRVFSLLRASGFFYIYLWLEGIGPSCPRFFPLFPGNFGDSFNVSQCLYLLSYSVICILNCLLFNVRCVLFHFFLCCICGENNLESNTRKILIHPPQVFLNPFMLDSNLSFIFQPEVYSWFHTTLQQVLNLIGDKVCGLEFIVSFLLNFVALWSCKEQINR